MARAIGDGWRPWPKVLRWCRRCGEGPPKAFYNSRGLCNVCHKTLRGRWGPTWDAEWPTVAWSGKPTGAVGQVVHGPCTQRCGPLKRHDCQCGGPGGVGYTLNEWKERYSPAQVLQATANGDISESLDAWDHLPSEISTQVPLLLRDPRRWLLDMVGKTGAPERTAEEAAKVANAFLYRWWATGPAVPGPGTLFVVKDGILGIAHVKPSKVIVDTRLWAVTAETDAAEIAWSQGHPDTEHEEEETPLTATKAAPPSLVSVKRKVSVPLGDIAVACGLTRPQVYVDGDNWELGWPVGPDWLSLFGTLGKREVVVVWSSLSEGTQEAHTIIDTSRWRDFFSLAAARGRILSKIS